MDKKLGVLVIHGMGDHGDVPKGDTSVPEFSDRLFRGIRIEIRPGRMAKVAWREVQWSHVLQPKQSDFLRKIGAVSTSGFGRKFVLDRLSDAGSYRYTGWPGDRTYERVHGEVARVAAELRDDLGPDAPIMIFAHSLGGHVMSNYIYDMQPRDWPETGRKPKRARIHAMDRNGTLLKVPETPLERMETVVKIVTFGCNIPVFVMGQDRDEVTPILPPQQSLPDHLKLPGWWENCFTRADILGYPLGYIGAQYAALSRRQELVDRRISTGWGLAANWWLSHNQYWKAPKMHQLLGGYIKQTLEKLEA